MSPERVLELSYGEVTRHETLDAATMVPVPGGLLCQRIFGPVQRGVCGCGTYHRDYRKKLVRCGRCGVTLADPKERRKRMGHIKLAVPIVHPWYRRTLALLLAIPPRQIDAIVECNSYVVEQPGESPYEANQIISASAYLHYETENPNDGGFRALSGGKLIRKKLKELNIPHLMNELRGKKPSRRVNARLLLVRDLYKSGVDPMWILLTHLPVMPPDLRPVIVFDDGTVASSDLNDLYARVIIRNNRLQGLYQRAMPEALINIERKLLQGAVDALFSNGKLQMAKDRTGKKVLKSLSSRIEKKEGTMRRNLLGKRADYSGRSVIAVGPELKLHQCGLPLDLAMDICRPFVYSRLRKMGYASSLAHARIMVERRTAASVEALEDVLSEKTVLLNRAPSLHRMSIQAFTPVLHKERAIRLHPLVCSAFNADFDGDQMGVHLPVTVEAQVEARILMMSINNILSPASGKISIAPAQDMVLGVYYLTKDRGGCPGEGKLFADKDDIIMAYDQKLLDLHSKVKVRIDGQLVDTTPGRVIFSEIIPPALPFSSVNKTLKKKDLGKLLEMCYEQAGQGATVIFLDKIKEIGFKFATLSGISLSISDVTIPIEKQAIIAETDAQVKDVLDEFANGLLNEEGKHNRIVDLWKKASEAIADKVMASLGVANHEGLSEAERTDMKEFNSVFMMADSGARGSREQIRQLAGMRGLMAKPNGELVEIPIKSNFKEGLTYHEYLLSCHGARKGRADGALKTKTAGHFTRRLVDCAHDVIVNAYDCGCTDGFPLSALYDGDDLVIPLKDRIIGRVLAEEMRESVSGEVLAHRNDIVTKEIAAKIEEAGFSEVAVRSPITCALRPGICALCYGHDLATRALPIIGDAVGIIAGQSVGEPGTQLTLRTFHEGGSAAGSGAKADLFAKSQGAVTFKDILAVRGDAGLVVVGRNGRISISRHGSETDAGSVPYGATLTVEEGDIIEPGQKLAHWDPFNLPLVATAGGVAELDGFSDGKTIKRNMDSKTGITLTIVSAIFEHMVPQVRIGEKQYYLPIGAIVLVKEGQNVSPGDVLAYVPKAAEKNADITGGLQRVLQVIEIRKMQNTAVIAEIDGQVTIHPPRGKLLGVEIINDNDRWRCDVSIDRQLNIFSGDVVRKGDILAEGPLDILDVLRILGAKKAALHVIDEVQKVYRSQGVELNDKHLEIILRKMLAKVLIVDPGDTDFVVDEIVSKWMFAEENDRTKGKCAVAKPLIVSLTDAALLSDSWLSAASFQNTTLILAEAALRKRLDPLAGTKENILTGNMVPVGTGHPVYSATYLPSSSPLPQPQPSRRVAQAQKKFAKLFKDE